MTTRILFEGPDGAGKTTAAKYVAEMLKMEYLKFSQSKSVSQALGITNNVIRYRDNVVIDRIKSIDHLIYGSEIDHTLFSLNDAFLMGRMTQKLIDTCDKFILVYMHANVDTLWERLTARGDETYVQKDQLQYIIRHYQEMLGNYYFSNDSILRIDTTHLPLSQAKEYVLREVTSCMSR